MMSRKKRIFLILAGVAALALCASRIRLLVIERSAAYVEQGRSAAKQAYDAEDQEIRMSYYEQAIENWTRALKLNPWNHDAYYYRGLVYQYQKEDYDRAIGDFTRAIKLRPDYAFYYARRGDVYRLKEDYDQAIADYTEAIVLSSDNADYYKDRGDTYEKKGDYEKALTDYDSAIVELDRTIAERNRILEENPEWAEWMDPTHEEIYKEREGVMTTKKTVEQVIAYERAIVDYTEVIRLNPGDASAYSGRGNAYRNKGDYDRAIADYTEAIRLNPSDASAYMNRGDAYEGIKDYDRAIADYTEAIKLQPDNEKAYGNRGMAYSSKGDNSRAKADIEEMLRINPRSDEAQLLLYTVFLKELLSSEED
jgi:tetratricopeptide (TPR) repeat protein